jgi:hypothetical protein
MNYIDYLTRSVEKEEIESIRYELHLMSDTRLSRRNYILIMTLTKNINNRELSLIENYGNRT